MRFVTDLFTEADGKTWDLGRVQGTIGFATFLALAVYSVVVKGAPFNAQEFGIGFGSVSLAYGAMVMLKDKEKP